MVCIHIGSKDGKLPSRMTFGLNYHKGERPGSNISSSVLMASSHGAKSRSWLWGGAPIQRNGNSLILLSHMNKDRNDRSTPDYRLTLYGPGGELATTEGTLPNGCGVNIQMETLLEEAGVHLPVGAFVWYVVQSDNPSMISNQIHISESGAIGGDHSF